MKPAILLSAGCVSWKISDQQLDSGKGMELTGCVSYENLAVDLGKQYNS